MNVCMKTRHSVRFRSESMPWILQTDTFHFTPILPLKLNPIFIRRIILNYNCIRLKLTFSRNALTTCSRFFSFDRMEKKSKYLLSDISNCNMHVLHELSSAIWLVITLELSFASLKSRMNFAGKFKHISIVFKSFSSFLLTMLAIHVACFISVKLLCLISFYSNRLVTCMINIITFN